MGLDRGVNSRSSRFRPVHAVTPSASRGGRRTRSASPRARGPGTPPRRASAKRSKSAAARTCAGTASSIAASSVHRPSPESDTCPRSRRATDRCASARAVRSRSHEATTLPRRQTSVDVGEVEVVLVVAAGRGAASSRRRRSASASRCWRDAGCSGPRRTPPSARTRCRCGPSSRSDPAPRGPQCR